MAHIHTQPGHHDLTVSAYIVRTDGSRPKILLHLHKSLKSWMQIGGHVELDETPWTAIKREIKEESGYDISQLLLLQPEHGLTDLGDISVAHPQPFLFATYPYGAQDHFHTDLSFIFLADTEPHHSLGENESAEIGFFTRQDIATLPPEQITPNVRTTALYVFDTLLDTWEPINPSKFR